MPVKILDGFHPAVILRVQDGSGKGQARQQRQGRKYIVFHGIDFLVRNDTGKGRRVGFGASVSFLCVFAFWG